MTASKNTILDKFILRKLLHIMLVITLLPIAKFGIESIGLDGLLMLGTTILLFLSLAEFARIEFGWFKFTEYLIKSKEKNNFFAMTYALAISLVLLAVFEISIAFAAISIAFLGDAAASIIGKKFGRNNCRFNPEKTWEGFLAHLTVGILVSLYFLPLSLGIPMAVAAASFELACSKIEDNFFIQLVTAFAGYLFSLI